MKKIAFLALAAALALTACRKNDSSIDRVDPYQSFKDDATPRWENGTTKELNDAGGYTFVIDTGNSLFSSSKYKTGRIWDDGNNYEILEFNGATTGKPSGPTIRKPSGVTDLHSLEIMKVESGKLWIVFRETASSTERRVVQ